MRFFVKGCVLCAALCCGAFPSRARTGEAEALPRAVVKLSHWTFVGVVNPAVELPLGGHWTLQWESLAVFARKDFLHTGHPLLMGNAFVDLRYYLRAPLRGPYVGPDLGYGVWKMNRKLTPGLHGGGWEIASSYQVGWNVLCGLTLGWHFPLGVQGRWGLDLSWTPGFHRARFDSFSKADDLPLPSASQGYASFLPAYKGGIFLSYKF